MLSNENTIKSQQTISDQKQTCNVHESDECIEEKEDFGLLVDYLEMEKITVKNVLYCSREPIKLTWFH